MKKHFLLDGLRSGYMELSTDPTVINNDISVLRTPPVKMLSTSCLNIELQRINRAPVIIDIYTAPMNNSYLRTKLCDLRYDNPYGKIFNILETGDCYDSDHTVDH